MVSAGNPVARTHMCVHSFLLHVKVLRSRYQRPTIPESLVALRGTNRPHSSINSTYSTRSGVPGSSSTDALPGHSTGWSLFSFYQWDIRRYYRVRVNNVTFMVQKLYLRYHANKYDVDANGVSSQQKHDLKSRRCHGWSLYVYSNGGDKLFCLLYKRREIIESHYAARVRSNRAEYYAEEASHMERIASQNPYATASTSAATAACPGGTSGSGCQVTAPEVELNVMNLVKAYSKSEPNYYLTIGDGKVIHAPSDASDEVQGLCEWRDYIARAEDESTGYVLPDRVLLELAKEMPVSVNKLRQMLKSKHPHIERNVDSVVSAIKQSVQNRAAFESAAQSLKEGDPVTVMDNDIEPTTEGKDINHHTADVASPSLKESLGVEKWNTGPIMVAADTNEGRGLGTSLFGSAKVIHAPSDASHEVQVMDNDIEPTTEGKDINHHTADVASPSLKESLGVEKWNTGPIMVAADTNEGRGLGTSLFGSAKVIHAPSDASHEVQVVAFMAEQFLGAFSGYSLEGPHGLPAEEGKSTCSWVSLGETSNMMRRSKKARKGA